MGGVNHHLMQRCMSPEHTEIVQVIHDTANMLLTELGGRIDKVEGRMTKIEAWQECAENRFDRIERKLDFHDQKFVDLQDLMLQHHDIVLRRLERIEDEYTATNALLRRHGILRTAG